MITTFLIGNGFDIGIGMKTRFTDMYEGYVQTDSKSECISVFKQQLEKEAPDYNTWSDFEMGMAKYANTIRNENDFVACIRDFKSYLVQHLEREEKEWFDYLETIHLPSYAREMRRSISGFYKGQSRNVIASIDNIMNRNLYREHNFISFNYTQVLDYMLQQYATYFKTTIGIPIHIHGKIGEDIVLGVDNKRQINNFQFSSSTKVQRAFVKPLFNQEFDARRVQEAMNMIERSDVICVYGMSLGESDRTWTNKLIEWLRENNEHILIYYDYTEEQYNACNWDEIMDAEDEKRELFLKRILNVSDCITDLSKQVHIPVAYDIFDFGNVEK